MHTLSNYTLHNLKVLDARVPFNIAMVERNIEDRQHPSKETQKIRNIFGGI